MKDLNRIKSRRFTYRDVMEALEIKDYHILKETIDHWITKGSIEPVKKAGRTSFVPSVYEEYRKINVKPDYSEYKEEISILNPALNISGYLNSPGKYVESASAIKQLSDYLWKHSELLKHCMSVKERSYQIWKSEKFLESSAGKKLCSFNKFNYDFFNCFYAPESFFSIDMHEKSDKVTALVVENKDTWYSLGKVLRKSENKKLLRQKIDVLIYGEGNKAVKYGAIKEFMEDYIEVLPAQEYAVLYIGDIDIAGINMLYGCMEHNAGDEEYRGKGKACVILPFIPLYSLMLERLIHNMRTDSFLKITEKQITEYLDDTDDHRGHDYNKSFLKYFSPKERIIIKYVLDNNKRIPQEIMTYSDYLALVE
jgi:hypothetical protein